MPVKLYTVPETAEHLRCSEMHVYRLIGRGELRAADIGTGRSKTRIRADDLAGYIESRTRGGRDA